MKNDLNYAVELIRKSDGILITAGAGMSVDSGLPDFRSSGGFWNAYPAFREHNLNFQDIATPMSFETHTELIYWFYGHRLVQYRNTTPHEGYQILKRWAAENHTVILCLPATWMAIFKKPDLKKNGFMKCMAR